jgi:folate-dependent phosphoribosylglycinamide formyltransferase PurN
VLELELKETAINVHFVDADYDTGQPIVTYPITVLTIASIMMDHEEAAKALQRYVLGYEHKLLPLIVDWLLSCSFMAVHTEGGVDIVINGKSVVKNSRLTEPLE